MHSKKELIELLHSTQCSCVVANEHFTLTFHERGVKDLHRLLHEEAQPLRGAYIADKVVGKGAAALMIAARAKWIYAKVISEAALELFARSDVEVEYETRTPHIINRSGTDICPVEKLCATFSSAEECLPAIDEFVKGLQ